MLNRETIERIKNIVTLFRKNAYSSDYYGSYILRFVFLKWLSGLYSKDSFQNNKINDTFTLPKEANWIYIENLAKNIGEKLTKIFYSIEQLNPKLNGILLSPSANWEQVSDHILKNIIKEFSAFDYDENIFKRSELLKEIYGELIVNTELYGMKPNMGLSTPYNLIKLIVELVQPEARMQIYDPACGSAGMLVEVARYFKEQGKSSQYFELWGQEKNYELLSIASMNLLIHSVNNYQIISESIITKKPVNDEGKPQKFDMIITNPPFGVKNWEDYEFNDDTSRYFQYGHPPKSSADYVFIQYVIAMLKDTGRATIIVPHGVLFRGGVEGEIRENIVKDDLIEAIIGLPPNLFYNTKIATAIIIFNKQKQENRKNNILFIDASHEYISNRKQNSLSDKMISRIVSTYSNFKEEAAYSRIASQEDISKYDYILTISSYVEPKKAEFELDIDSQVKKVQGLEAQRSEIEAKMNACLKGLGIKI